MSAILLLTLSPASAQQKKSSLSNPATASAATSVDPKNETIRKVAQLIDGMGYTVKNSGADYIVIEANSLVVAIEPAGDGSSVFASIYFSIPNEKKTLIPYPQLLDYNGHAADYFGTSKLGNDGGVSIALMDHIPTADLSPRTLKDMLDLVTGDAHRHLDLLDPGNWKSALPDFGTK